MRLLGLDPGLRATGWGIIDVDGNALRHVANGVLWPEPDAPLATRLVELYEGLCDVIDRHKPDTAAVEETFFNANPRTTLRLGQACGVVILAPANAGLPVSEYAANVIKKSVVGVGHAAKIQVTDMVRRLLPGCVPENSDAADALAVAICHAHHAQTARRVANAGSAA